MPLPQSSQRPQRFQDQEIKDSADPWEADLSFELSRAILIRIIHISVFSVPSVAKNKLRITHAL
jgi:hypothetical protein